MIKSLVIIVLLWNGNIVLERLPFKEPVTLEVCSEMSDLHRTAYATYRGNIGRSQGWFLNDGRGLIQGYICD